jgi:hypothetical protein
MLLSLARESLSGPTLAELRPIFHCLIGDSPNLEGQVPIFISPRNRVAQLYPPGAEFLFRRLLRLVELRWRYSNSLPHWLMTQLKIKIVLWTMVSRPVCPGIRPPSGPMTNFYFSSKFSFLSGERTGLWFTVLEGPRQHSAAWVWFLIFPLIWRARSSYLSPRNRAAQIYSRTLG